MLDIKELVKIRKLLSINGVDIAEEMGTTKQTVSNIELGKTESTMMATRFYKITTLKLIEKVDKEKREKLKCELKSIIEYLDSLEA